MTAKTENKSIERPDWLPAEAWPYPIETLELDGSPIAYTDEGEGPVLLLVHDGMWSYIWGQLIGVLRTDHRVITLDFPGSGLSPESGRSTSLEGDSMLLESFVQALGLDRVTLVVHDLGGAVGVGLAARRPELIDGLVLVNTFAWPPHVRSLRAMFRIMISRPVRAINVATNLIPRLTTTSSGIGRHLDRSGREAFLGGFRHKAARRRFHDLIAAAGDETEYLAELESALGSTLSTKPALTVYGEKNDPFGFQDKFGSLLDDVDEMVIPEGNHFPMADDPEGVAAAIATWHRTKVQA
jgi:pimeloyl-ACP methyl ester carboxylesterase